MSRTYRRALLPVLVASLSFATLAWAFHAVLVKAVPAVDGTVIAAPTELTLWFNERPDASLSNIRLIAPDSSVVLVGGTHATADSMSVMTTVRGPMTPGKYTVTYRTAGPDGHVMRGKYQFTYQP
jgi:methionine-rich copper-binding protein CopC